MSFGEKTLIWRTCMINKALSTIKQVQIINKKDIVITVLDADSKTFIIYVIIQKQEEISVYFKK